MKIVAVTESDMKFLGQLINTLQNGEYKFNGKDICAAADSIRWLQKSAVEAASCYAESVASAKEVVAPEKVAAPSSPARSLGDGMAIKSFHPGKASKSK